MQQYEIAIYRSFAYDQWMDIHCTPSIHTRTVVDTIVSKTEGMS